MAEELRKLGGEIDAQFTYRPDQTSIATAEHAVRMDQEAICGYKLIMLKQRSMELADAQGRYVEVFITYGPYPVVAPEQIAADPSLQPVNEKEIEALNAEKQRMIDASKVDGQ